MLSILLAEDEFITRVGIRYCLDGAGGPFRLVGEAVNGKQALEMCRTLRPDILLTDIRMPEMDGLELIREIRREEMDIRIVILTCLEEFSYLHEAMHLGIEDYILKTALKPEKLMEVLETVRQKIGSAENGADSTDPNDAEDALESILLGYVNDTEEIGRMVERYHLDLCFDRYVLMLACPEKDAPHAPHRGLRAALADCLKMHARGDAVRCDKKRYALLVRCPDACEDPGEARTFLTGLVQEMDRTCRLNLNVSLQFGISDLHHDPEHIGNALEEADCALSHRYFLPGEKAYFFGQRRDREHSLLLRRLHTELESLQAAASRQDREGLLNALYRFDAAAKEAQAQGTEIWPWYLRAYFDAVSVLDGSADGTPEEEMDLLSRELHSPEEAVSAVIRLLTEQAQRFGDQHRPPSNSLIEQVLDYTHAHFADNLTLSFISQTFAIHPAYFCKLFKRTVGTTYIDYLTQYRVGRAKELLRTTDLPNYLIAEQTGFQTPEYFSKTFKKKTGVSPKEYRQR